MINVREFELLSSELSDLIIFLKKCRITEENKGLFDYLDVAIKIGSSHMQILSGFQELDMQNVNLEKYHVQINKQCTIVKAYISEIKKVKEAAI
jgi:hypothetical protein